MVTESSLLRLLLPFLTLPALAFSNPICSPPYECMASKHCADQLSGSATEEFLFRCENMGEICCPPLRTTNITSVKSTQASTRTNESNSTAIFKKLHSNKGMDGQRDTTTNLWTVCGTGKKETAITRATTPKGEMTFPVAKFTSHRNFRLLPSKCGLNDFPNRITEGEEADLGEFPWMALVGFREGSGNLRWICGGTLISQRYVMTAAHCIYRQRGAIPVVRLGEHNLENETDCDHVNNYCLDPPIDLNVEEIIQHEEWNSTTIKNDIALFRLPHEIQETYSVSPICLPFDFDKRNSSENKKYEVAGWGKTDWNSHTGSSVLRKASLSSISNMDCNLCKGKKKEKYCPITQSQICAQGWKAVDVCKGDSGGPLMISYHKTYQVGITSFKTSEYCGADNIPSIFTRVESYLDWILNNIKN